MLWIQTLNQKSWVWLSTRSKKQCDKLWLFRPFYYPKIIQIYKRSVERLFGKLNQSIKGFLKITRIVTVMIPDGHNTVYTILWRYHGNTVIILVMILDVLLIKNDTIWYQVCKVLFNIAWNCSVLLHIVTYCLESFSIVKVLSGIARHCQVLPGIARYCQELPSFERTECKARDINWQSL